MKKEEFTYEPMEPEEKTSSKIITFIIFWIIIGTIIWILGIMYPSRNNSSQYPEDTCQDAAGNLYPC